MEELKRHNVGIKGKEKVVVLYFLRSSRKRCIEGYCVSIHRYDVNMGEVVEGSLNIFGEGIYSRKLSDRFYKAVATCVNENYKFYKNLNKKKKSILEFWDILKVELEDVWCSIDGNGVTEDIKDLESIYNFIKRWDR